MTLSYEQEYKVVIAAIKIIREMTDLNENVIVQQLTGWAWDEEEAGHIRSMLESGTE